VNSGHMPVECRNGLSAKQLVQIWVKGLYFAPVAIIRGANPNLLKGVQVHFSERYGVGLGVSSTV
jgi:hypothetical protein